MSNQNTIQNALEALNSISSSMTRVEWFKIACSMKDAGLTFDHFHEWSAKGANYESKKDCQSAWKSIKDGGINKAYLFKIAQDSGWENTGDGESQGKDKDKKTYFANSFNLLETYTSHAYITEQGLDGKLNGYQSVIKQGQDKDGVFIADPIFNIENNECVGFNRIYKKGCNGKLLAKNTKKSGNAGLVGKVTSDTKEILICEGMADALHIHNDTNSPVFIASDAGNLPAVTQNIKKKYPDIPITIIADNDIAGIQSALNAKPNKIIYPIFHKDYTDAVLDKCVLNIADAVATNNLSTYVYDSIIKTIEATKNKTASDKWEKLITNIAKIKKLSSMQMEFIIKTISNCSGVGVQSINRDLKKQLADISRAQSQQSIEARKIEHEQSETPIVIINNYDDFVSDVSTPAMNSLIQANTKKPRIFATVDGLSRIIISDTDMGKYAALQILDSKTLRHELQRSVKWIEIKKDKKTGEITEYPTVCPITVAEDILSYSQFESFPPLNRIITAPFVTTDNLIVFNKGYYRKSKTFYHQPEPLDIKKIEPTTKNIKYSISLINEMLVDFPFDSTASKTNAIACIILPFVRDLIDGPTPLHYFSAPTLGTGKSLLAESIATIFNPNISLTTAPKGRSPDSVEEEWRKKISTMLKSANTHICIDNISGRVDSSNLASVLTMTQWEDRQLGSNNIIKVPNNAVWMATANNAELSEELTRRCLEIRLDSNEEKPAERDPEKFKHSNLKKWIKDNRARLITAILILVQNWLDKGKPKPTKITERMGSFESWLYVIGGILESAGIDGFLDNRNKTKERVNTSSDIYVEFIKVWAEKFKTPQFTKELYDLAKNETELFNEDGGLISYKGETGEMAKLGRWLSTSTDKIIAGYKIQKGHYGSRTNYYLDDITNDKGII